MRPLLLLVLGLGLVAPSSARASCYMPEPPAAQIDRAYRFDGSLAAHYPAGGPAAEAVGSPTFEAGRGRQVLDADPGDGVRVATAGTSRGAWSVVLDVRLDQHTPVEQRILGLSGDDSGVYAKDGRLVVASGSSRSDAGALPPAGQWFQLVVSNDPSRLARTSVHLDGAQRVNLPLALGDHVEVFKDDGVEDGAGQLAGLRLFTNALGSALPNVGSPDDLAPPTVRLEVWQAPGAFMRALPSFVVSGDDGGRPASRVGLRMSPPGPGTNGEVPLNHRAPGNGHGEAPWEMRPLPDGAQYDLRYSAVDYAGNVTSRSELRTVDGRAPTGLSIDATPESTSDTTPLISGRTAVAPGDDPHVVISIWKRRVNPVARAACSVPGPGPSTTQWIEATIGPDGSFSAESGERYAVGDVLDVGVLHVDHVRNAQSVHRTVTIVAPPAVAPDRRGFLARAATALGRQLRKISRRSLARRRGAAVTVDADAPGALRVELRSRGRRPAVLSRVTATFRKAGRRRVRLRPTLAGRRALLRASRVTLRLSYVPRGERAVVRSQALSLRR